VKPDEVARAEFIVNLCRQFHVLPSQLMDEPVEIVQLLALADLGDTEGGG
jgi:hypothetical protein